MAHVPTYANCRRGDRVREGESPATPLPAVRPSPTAEEALKPQRLRAHNVGSASLKRSNFTANLIGYTTRNYNGSVAYRA
jgi:hypothetical protein